MAILRKLTKAFTRILLKYPIGDRKSTRLNSSHDQISYAVFCLKKKNTRAQFRSERKCRPPNPAPNHSTEDPACLEDHHSTPQSLFAIARGLLVVAALCHLDIEV